MKASSLLAALALSAALAAFSQDPTLHTRPATGQDDVPVQATGHTDLPPEAEGVYPWNGNGSGNGNGSPRDCRITLFFEENTLRGYMAELDAGAPITLPFIATRIDGSALSFTTRRVHGRDYSFVGRLVRGAATSPTLPGYYLLTGTLTGSSGKPRPLRVERQPGMP